MIGILILIVEPEDEILFIGTTKTGYILPRIRTTRSYRLLLENLPEGSSIINWEIDFVPDEEANFWLTFYSDLLKSWGFSLFEFEKDGYFNMEADAQFLSRFHKMVTSHSFISSCANAYNADHLELLIQDIDFYIKNGRLLKYQIKELLQFELLFSLTIYNGVSPTEINKLTWDDLLNQDKIKVAGIEIPLLKRCRYLATELNSIWKRNKDKKVFPSPKINKRFPEQFNSLMIFFGLDCRLSHNSDATKQHFASYWLRKRGYSYELHKFLSFLLDTNMYELLDQTIIPSLRKESVPNLQSVDGEEFLEVIRNCSRF